MTRDDIQLLYEYDRWANNRVHRGQIAQMMRQLGAAPAPTDFHVFLVEGLEIRKLAGD